MLPWILALITLFSAQLYAVYQTQLVRLNNSSSTVYLTRGGDLTGITDGKTGTISVWVKALSGNGTQMRIFNNVGGFIKVFRDTDNKWKVQGFNSSSTKILELISSVTYGEDQNVIHLAASWDLEHGYGRLYIGGANVLAGGSTLTDDNIDYVRASPDWAVGATTVGGNRFDGNFSELWFNNSYIDWSNPTEMAKFNTGGAPADLGSNGQTPTGASPLVYIKGPAASITTNLGTGGNFSATGTPLDRDKIPVEWIQVSQIYMTRTAPRLNLAGPIWGIIADVTFQPFVWNVVDVKPYGVPADAVMVYLPYLDIVTEGSASESVTPQITLSLRAYGDTTADPAFYVIQGEVPSTRIPGGIWVPLTDGKFEFYYTQNTDCCWPTHPAFQINFGIPQMWGR